MFGLDSYYVKENEKLIRHYNKIYMIIDNILPGNNCACLLRQHQHNSKMVSLWLLPQLNFFNSVF